MLHNSQKDFLKRHIGPSKKDEKDMLVQLGFGFILITIGARRTPSAMVGIIMLTEAVLGPLWAWLFINEKPPLIAIIGGSIVIFAVLLQFLPIFKKNHTSIKP